MRVLECLDAHSQETMTDSIFDKPTHLKPSSMATVADRRFGDAKALAETRVNARANGVAYMSGFVVEILLKARLVAKYPSIARKRQHQVKNSERAIWLLIWRQHDLDGMLGQMRELESALAVRGQRDGQDYVAELKKVCATWTIQARYSPHMMKMDEAERMLERVRILKELLK